MATRVIKFFLALSIIFYVLLAFYLFYAVDTIRENEFQTASDFASVINNRIDSAYSIDLSFSSDYFRDELDNIFSENNKFAGVILYSESFGTEYAKLRQSKYLGSEITSDLASLSEVPEITPVHPFVKVFSSKIYFADGESVHSILIFDLLDRGLFFPVLRNTLIVAVIYLVLSIICLLINSSKSSSKEEYHTFTKHVPEPLNEDDDDETEFLNKRLPDIDDEKPSVEKTFTDSSGGMYSDRSGLVWEHFLAEKLDAELKRAASFDQDSCLVFISIYSPSGFIPYRNISELIVEHFSYKDLAFESGENTFCVIIPEKDIDEGQIEVDKFRRSLLRRFPDSSYRIYAGLTSRNSRLLSDKRMIQEARAALKKAESETESTTIAFRTDLSKYREYIASTL